MLKVIGIALAGIIVASAAWSQNATPTLQQHEKACTALATATFANIHAGCDNLAIKILEGTTVEGCTAMSIVLRNRNFRKFMLAAEQPTVMPPERVVEQLRTLCTEFINTAVAVNGNDRRIECLGASRGRAGCY
jgi:hypothetical protein